MKKISYSLIVALALVALVGAQAAQAEDATTSNSGGGWLGKFFPQKAENLQNRENKIEDRVQKIASTSARIEDRLQGREQKIASTTARIEDKFGNASTSPEFQARLKEREQQMASTSARILEREAHLASTTRMLEQKFEDRASSTKARVEKLAEKFTTGIENQIGRVVDSLNQIISNLKNINDRITSRIEKLKADNVDTSVAESLFADAQTKLAAATDQINLLQSGVSATLTDGISTTTKETIKTKIATVRDSVQAAREAYVKVVTNLKTISPQEGTATSTNQ